MFKISIIFLFSLFSLNCYASGKVSYGIHALGTSANDDEVDCTSRSTCNNVGTRLMISYHTEEYSPLWRAEITFKPRALSYSNRHHTRMELNGEESAVNMRYVIYGDTNIKEQKNIYDEYYNRNKNEELPSCTTGNFRCTNMMGNGFLNFNNTELISFDVEDDNSSVSIEYIITIIDEYKKKDGSFPLYSAKGFSINKKIKVLNCITFQLSILHDLDIPVMQNDFIKDYFNKNGMKEIAYPQIFLEPLIEVCKDHGGRVNLENISGTYNEFYYNHSKNNNISNLLRYMPKYGENVDEFQIKNMLVLGRPAQDRYNMFMDHPIPNALGGTGLVVGGVIGWFGLFGATTVAFPAVIGGVICWGGAHTLRFGFNKITM
jgi:hypothetical protein